MEMISKVAQTFIVFSLLFVAMSEGYEEPKLPEDFVQKASQQGKFQWKLKRF